MFVFAGAATGLMGALNPLVTGVVLKVEASNTTEIDSRAIERARCAQAWLELFCCFFIGLFRLKQFSCRFLLSPSFSTICRSGLRKSPEIGKDPDSRWGLLGGTFFAKIGNSPRSVYRGRAPIFC